jgi:hypothetical protein
MQPFFIACNSKLGNVLVNHLFCFLIAQTPIPIYE